MSRFNTDAFRSLNESIAKVQNQMDEGVIRDTVQRVRNKVRGAGFRTDRELDAMPKRVFMPASPAAKRRHKVEDSKKSGEVWQIKPDSFGQTRVGAKNADGSVRYFRSGMEAKAKGWAKKKQTGKRVPFFKDDPYRD
jgi:hypothetical protein